MPMRDTVLEWEDALGECWTLAILPMMPAVELLCEATELLSLGVPCAASERNLDIRSPAAESRGIVWVGSIGTEVTLIIKGCVAEPSEGAILGTSNHTRASVCVVAMLPGEAHMRIYGPGQAFFEYIFDIGVIHGQTHRLPPLTASLFAQNATPDLETTLICYGADAGIDLSPRCMTARIWRMAVLR